MTIAPADLAGLRARMVTLRGDLLRQLAAADHINPGHLGLLPGIDSALTALDSVPDDAAQVARAVVVNNGSTIALALYCEDGGAASVELSPRRAIGLANELIDAGLRRL